MLVLTRKADEAIQIGDEIEITILSVKGEQVKIGINAPKHVEIHRKEVYLDIQEENKIAAGEVENILSILSISKNKKI